MTSHSPPPELVAAASTFVHDGHSFELCSAEEVPDSHFWASPEDHPVITGPTDPARAVPVIDLAEPEASRRMARALESLGVFQLTGHRIPAGVLRAIEAQSRRLFALPSSEKLKVARAAGSISGYGLVPISSFFSKLMWSEGFTVAGSPRSAAAALWPDNPDPFCEAVGDYEEEMRILGGRVAGMVLEGLGLEDENSWGIVDAEGVLQLNWYPDCPEPARAMGMAAHTDSGLITVLHQTSSSSGLQIFRADEVGRPEWVPVSPVEGALVIIAGDLLHVFTDGRFRSVVHRVMVNKAVSRFSVAYFCGPPRDLAVGPDPRLVDWRRGPQFRSVTWAEYRGIRRRLFQGAIDEIRLLPAGRNHRPQSPGLNSS